MDTQKILCFGEMLLRLNCPGYRRFGEASSLEMLYGGSEANVAVLLARLGMEVEYLTRLPDNDLASSALDLLRQNGVGTRHVLRGGERLGLYFSETGNALRATRIIYDRTHSSFSTLQPGMIGWKEVLTDCGWFHWSGISPAVSASVAAVCKEGLGEAEKQGIPISADFNYRSTLWQYGNHPQAVMPGLLDHCEVVTGDIDAAGAYFGIGSSGGSTLRETVSQYGAELQKKLPRLKILAMSFREMQEGGTLAYSGMLMKGAEIHFHGPYPISHPVGRIGSGDAFMGGLIYGLLNKKSLAETIALATAAGALKHSIVADIPLFGLEELNSLVKNGPSSGRVIR